MATREAAVSAREAELVTLFAELLNQKKALENNQADENSITARTSPNADNKKNMGAEKQGDNIDVKDARIVLGGIENVYLDPPGLEFGARIDTGAQTSSLNAIDMINFERDGKPYVKFHVFNADTGEKIELTRRIRRYVRVKEQENESQRRPVVKMRVVLANIDESIDFTLVDRSKFKHQILIGRNFLRDLAIVDVSKAYTASKTDNNTDHRPK
ncbi:ATP-dependent zinc protease family protein [Nitrosomonas cryotolerans]|uniref:ATP-dependent zinc protease family protein n=1 Tax=Nitrosomonas cryotolerans TaxID=44575 RepID=UPI000B06A657|nr:RimK/LysX family protein [Nitrosomonas cryotolerans]